MTVIALLAAGQTKPVFLATSEIYEALSDLDLDVGELVFYDTTGYLARSDASVAGTAVCHGVVVKAQGNAYSIAKRARIGGLDLSGMDYGDPGFISDTAGDFDDAAGTVSVQVGIVVPLSDRQLTKIFDFEAPSYSA